MRKNLLLFMLIAAAVNAWGQVSKPTGPTAVLDGVFYIFDPATKTAQVGDAADWANQLLLSGDVVIPEQVTYENQAYTVTGVAAYAFCDYNTDLTSVKLPNTILKLDCYAFSGFVPKTFTVPNSVTEIEHDCFEYASLESLVIGSGIQNIGANAFKNCTALTAVQIDAATPPTITATTFPAAIKSKITLTVPKGTLSAYQSAANWSGFKAYKEGEGGGSGGGDDTEPAKIEVDGIYYQTDPATSTATVISGYQAGLNETPYSGVVNVPSTFTYKGKTYTVTAVGQTAFQYGTCTEVTLPSTCTTLATYAFSSMSSLTKLDLGGVNNIPGNGITNCTALKDLYLGYTGGVVGTVGASIPSAMRANINVHVASAALKSSYSASSFWGAVRAILAPDQLQIGDFYYEYYPATRTAMVLAPYEIPGNGAPKQIGPAVEIPGTITVSGTEYTVTRLQPGVFYETPNVTSVTFNEGLKEIGFETFYASQMSELTFPNSVETIEYNNFYYCTKLTKVTFGTGLKYIGNNAFYACNSVTDIEVQATVPPAPATGSTSIFNANFNKGNVTLTVPAGTKAAYQADANWSGFKEYKEIGGGAIEEGRIVVDGIHYEITKNPYASEEGTLQCYVVSPVESGYPNGDEYSGVVTIPEFITYNNKKYAVVNIGNEAFYMQSGVTEVKIPGTVTIIGTKAFAESGITAISIPASVQRIDNYAFRRCTALKGMTAKALTPATASSGSFTTITTTCTLYVPRGCVSAYKAANYWKDFTNIEEDPTSAILPTSVTITGMPRVIFVGDSVQLSAVILPENATDKTVEWKSLTPQIVTVDTTGMMKVIGSGNALVEVICNGNRTLSTNTNVICVTPQAEIDGISYRFQYNEKAKLANAYVIRPKSGSYSSAVNIPASVQHGSTFTVRGIDANAFAMMSGVTSVAIPATVDTMGYDAFRGCSGLQRVDITNLTSWANIDFKNERSTPFSNAGVGMYLNNQPVKAVSIAGSIRTVKPYVFQGIGSITTLSVAEGVRQISTSAFKGCTGLTTVTLPASIDSIGLNAFNGCSALAKANIPANVKVVAGGIFANTALQSIVIPDGVYLIDNQAFLNCASLKSVNIGSGVRKLNLMVFDGCSQLDTVTVNAITPPEFFQASIPGQTLNPFDPAIYPTCRLYVPAQSLNAYKGANVWKNFATIRAIGSAEGVKADIDGISYSLLADELTATVLPAAYTGEITIPATVSYQGKTYAVTEIAPRAFYGTTIDILRLPAGIKSIPTEMAANCQNLVSVGLPDHLETIGVRAFYDSPNIRFIRCVNYGVNNNLVPPAFTATDESSYGEAFSTSIWPDCMLAIPGSMYANYRKANGWSNFRSYAYWHDTDVSPDSVVFTGKFSGEERTVRTLTPVVYPSNALILNYVVRNSNPEAVSFATGKDDQGKTVLLASLLKVGEADVTVYMNLVKSSFHISVSVYTGVEGVDGDDEEARYFTLEGLEVARPQKGVMYIKVQRNKSTKIVY